jgi:hypothetical protein
MRGRRLAAAAACAVLLAAGAAGPAAGQPAASPVPVQVPLSIDAAHPGAPVPARFLGLSFEAAALGRLAGYAGHGDLAGLLRSLGPGMLRFGGVTADQNVAWSDGSTPAPPWASSTIGPADMRGLGRLTRRSGWSVLLTVGMAHYEPAAAARELAAAHRSIGSSLAAVEIGNEPDAYGKHAFRALPWLAQGYEEEVSSYREAFEALAPGVPLAGPDVTGSGVFGEWGEEEALAQQPAVLTGHHYPLGCAQVPAPSIELLLSLATREREQRSLSIYTSLARAYGIPLRIDEAGSVSCGGVAGISNTYAASLWATSYIAQTMSAGAAGINLEGNPSNCSGYTPLCAPTPAALASGALRAQPDWYALLLTRPLIGTRPLPVAVPAAANLYAAAFAGAGGTLQVVLVDEEPPGAAPLSVQVPLGAGSRPVRVLRLSAPSLGATAGVRLGGREVAPNGSWHPLPPAPVVRSGAASVTMAASSAALVTVGSPLAKHGPHGSHRG